MKNLISWNEIIIFFLRIFESTINNNIGAFVAYILSQSTMLSYFILKLANEILNPSPISEFSLNPNEHTSSKIFLSQTTDSLILTNSLKFLWIGFKSASKSNLAAAS